MAARATASGGPEGTPGAPGKPKAAPAAAAPRKGPRGKVSIRRELCKGCGFCAAFCPAGGLEMSKEFNRKGYHFPVLAHPDLCTGCGLCGMYCPDFAVFGFRVDAPAGREA